MSEAIEPVVDVNTIPWPPGVKITPRAKRFIAAYFGPANRVGVEAARIAGYSSPNVRASQLRRRFSEVIEYVELQFLESRCLSARQVREKISEIANNGVQESNRLKALELLARIQGQLSDKLDLNINRNQLIKDIDAVVTKVTPLALPESHQDRR